MKEKRIIGSGVVLALVATIGMVQSAVAAPNLSPSARIHVPVVLVEYDGQLEPITEPRPYVRRPGYSVICEVVTSTSTRYGRQWTSTRRVRMTTTEEKGSTVVTFEVLKYDLTGDLEAQIDDVGTGYRVVLDKFQNIIEKEFWLNPNFKWGKRQRAERIAGLEVVVAGTIETTKVLAQDQLFWPGELGKDRTIAWLRVSDRGAKLGSYSDEMRVTGIGKLGSETVIVIEGTWRYSYYIRGYAYSGKYEVTSYRYLDSGLMAGEEYTGSVNTSLAIIKGKTTCDQTEISPAEGQRIDSALQPARPRDGTTPAATAPARRGTAGPQQTPIKKAAASSETRPIAERLRALQNFLEKGLITKEEAAGKRRQILKDL